MRWLELSLALLVAAAVPVVATAQIGFDPDPPELILDAPPPDTSIPSVLDGDLSDLLGEDGESGLDPGDDALIKQDGQTEVNPPLPPELGGATAPTDGPTLRPGDDAIITRDGRTVVNPSQPAPTAGATPPPQPRRNPDGSTTYPPGVPVPFEDGIAQYNPDGSVTLVPFVHGRAAPPPEPAKPETPKPDAPASDEGTAVDTPSTSGLGRTREQFHDKLFRDEQQLHSRATPTAADLRSFRQSLAESAPQAPIYVPYVDSGSDLGRETRHDVAGVLRGLEERRRQRDARDEHGAYGGHGDAGMQSHESASPMRSASEPAPAEREIER